MPGAVVPPLAWLVDAAGRFVQTPINGSQLRMSRYRLWVDTAKARRELGLAKPRPFSQAAQDAFDWYRSAGMI
jgi:nucleoside-diphosphate-sugar epimerase